MNPSELNIAVLMPTYGRPTLLASAVACYEAQTHPVDHRRLLVLDDAGQVQGAGNGWRIWSTPERYPTLMEKYRALMVHLEEWWPRWDAVALMDDDDVYGPYWLSTHAEALTLPVHNAWSEPHAGGTTHADEWIPPGLWSYPNEVYSLYTKNVMGGDMPMVGPSGGRFWASTCISRALLEHTGGFQLYTRATFDQEHLALWQTHGGQPSRPDRTTGPQYVYGWGRARHVSLQMGDAEQWYARNAGNLTEQHRVERLVPRMDEATAVLYGRLWHQPSTTPGLRVPTVAPPSRAGALGGPPAPTAVGVRYVAS